MTDDLKTPDPLPDTIRAGAREASAAWWWIVALALGALWIWFGRFVLSYKVGRLVTLVTLVGVWAISRGVTEIFAGSHCARSASRRTGWSHDHLPSGVPPALCATRDRTRPRTSNALAPARARHGAKEQT